MLKSIELFVKEFLKKTEDKKIQVISHNDTDGITSAAILAKTLQRLDKEFIIQIVKQLEIDFIKTLPQDKIILFSDLGSNSFSELSKLNTDVFILDHHEVPDKKIPKNIHIINPHLFNEEEISGSGVCYLFSKKVSEENKDLADLAVFGMLGDWLDKSVSKLNNNILKESTIKIKKGLLLYPATRPLNKVLEFSSDIMISGVTGSPKGACNFLRDLGIKKIDGQYKSILELDEEEMSKLITAIMLRTQNNKKDKEIIGNIYLANFFNKLEDIRELNAMINACGSLGFPGTAISFCLEDKNAREKIRTVYTNYKQEIVKGLKDFSSLDRIEGKEYLIVNAQDKIKDTIIGTIASINSNSQEHHEGRVIVAMAYSDEKIKVSMRIAGRNGKNARKILNSVIDAVGGECGGHQYAAGCIIEKAKEQEFIEAIKKELEYEIVKV